MSVRTTMAQLIARERFLVGDLAGPSQTFADQDIQDTLDEDRLDLRYELLAAAPTVVNSSGTGNNPEIIWADYYSRYQWWESDITILGNNVGTGKSWVVLTPVSSDYIVGHWVFEVNEFTTATVPGQYPPVFAVGKSFDLYRGAYRLLMAKAAQYMLRYDVATDGQSFKRSQMYDQIVKQANYYLSKARPLVAKALRNDTPSTSYQRVVPVLGDLDSDWSVRG